MGKNGPRQAPEARVHTLGSNLTADTRATKPRQPAPPASVAKTQLQAKNLPAKKVAMKPARETATESDCNCGEHVPVLLQVTVGRNLRAARLAAGLTLRQVAELSGILFQYVYKIENGEKNLTLSTIDNLAKVLGVNASELLRKDLP